MPAIDRERRAKGRELETEWSNYEWNNARRQWQSFRINARGECEWIYRDPDTELDGAASMTLSDVGMSTQQVRQASTLLGRGVQFSPAYEYTEPAPTSNQDDNPYVPLATTSAPAPLQHSYSNPGTIQQSPLLDIAIFDDSNVKHVKVALMDTGAGAGLWIAHRIVEELKLPINYEAPEIKATLANDQEITSFGVVELTWKVSPGGKRTHKEPFNIFVSDVFDIILGMEYLSEKKIVRFDLTHLVPLEPAAAESQYHQARREQAQQEQQKGSENSEQRKKKSESKKADKKKKG